MAIHQNPQPLGVNLLTLQCLTIQTSRNCLSLLFGEVWSWLPRSRWCSFVITIRMEKKAWHAKPLPGRIQSQMLDEIRKARGMNEDVRAVRLNSIEAPIPRFTCQILVPRPKTLLHRS